MRARHRDAVVPDDARLFAHPRLEVVGEIASGDGVSFRALCDALGLSDGNLSAHLHALERVGIVESERGVSAGRRCTRYRLTVVGRARLGSYIDWIARYAATLSAHIGSAS